METRQLAVRFTETAQDEVSTLIRELRIIPIAEYLRQNNSPLPEELHNLLTGMLSSISDLFSVSIPEIEQDPEATLRIISRDINLGRLLKERGLFRLYRLVSERIWVDASTGEAISGVPDKNIYPDAAKLPMFMTIENPNTGAPFSTQEEFIGWFCGEAHVARSLAFMRIATIERTLSLGFDLQNTFDIIVAKPYAIRETLNMVASWEKGEMSNVSPDVAIQVTRKVAPDSSAEMEILAEAARQDPMAMQELMDAFKPVVAELISEVADHERAGDALDFVRHDVLMRPEISYTWDEESSALIIQLFRKQTDAVTGQEYETIPIIVPFVPDTLELPDEIRTDLIRRLPIKNKIDLDI